EGASAFVAAGGMLARGDVLKGVEIRGIDPKNEGNVSELPQQMISGSLDSLEPGSFKLVIGSNLAQYMGVTVGDTLLLMTPQGSINPSGFSPRMRQFTVSGIFSSGHYEYDSNMAFVAVKDAAVLFRDVGSAGVRLKIRDMINAPEVATQRSEEHTSELQSRENLV